MWPSSFKSRFSGFKSRKTIFLPWQKNEPRDRRTWCLRCFLFFFPWIYYWLEIELYHIDIYKHPRLRGFQPPAVWVVLDENMDLFSPCLLTSKHPSGYANDWKPQQRQQCRTWHGSLCQKDPSCCRWPWHSTMKVLGNILVWSWLQSFCELVSLGPYIHSPNRQAPNFWSEKHKAPHPAPAPVTNRDALGLPTSREVSSKDGSR